MDELKNDEYNNYLRYSYIKCSGGIAVTKKDGSNVVISKITPEKAPELYERLTASCPEPKG